jgi:tRNA A37 threonylcarbamoyladenosine dehydratase
VDNANDIVASLKSKNVDVVIDSIDGQIEKTALIAAACIHQLPIITCGGAAGRFDPSQIVCDDLSRSEQCRLLASCKNRLRDNYKLFKQGTLKKTPRRWKIWAVYSMEVQKQVVQTNDQTSSFRRCDGALGTACFVTGTYGFVAASKAVSMIANNELIVPRIPKSMVKTL